MAKVKLPLEMTNGIMVRTLEELNDNFDLKKVIGYFLDGKLQKWLEVRYYDEELEKVNQLSESDKDLSLKLCEIFGVEYNAENNIDTENIRMENERLIKLKQYTDDEDIIANIDSVAFNQEELSALYDRGVEKIYLCNGKFVIPKSKVGLIYIEFGGAKVKYLKPKSYLTKELADILFMSKCYADLQDYIIWDNNLDKFYVKENIKNKICNAFFKNKKVINDDGRFMAFNKNTDECFSFDVPDIARKEPLFNCNMIGYKNKIIYVKNKVELFAYDIENKKVERLYTCPCSINLQRTNSIYENYLLFYLGDLATKDLVLKINIDTKEVTLAVPNFKQIDNIYIKDKFLFGSEPISANARVIKIDLSNDSYEELLEITDSSQPYWYTFFEDELFFLKLVGGTTSFTAQFCGIKTDGTFKEYFERLFGQGLGTPYDNAFKNNQEIIIFNCYQKSTVLAFDLITKTLKTVKFDFNDAQGNSEYIGDYFYFLPDKHSFNPYRIDTKKDFVKDNFELVCND